MERTANKNEESTDTSVEREPIESEDSIIYEEEVVENTDLHAEDVHDSQQNNEHNTESITAVGDATGTPTQTEKTLEENKVRLHNHRALSKQSTTYELEKFEKNYMVIFNQVKIQGYEPRLGTHEDVEVLTETFKNFGFEVEEVLNPTKKRIFEVLDTFKTKNFTDYGSICVVVLTHGVVEGGLWAEDQVYSEQDLIDYFDVHNNPTLLTKAKILIIQACRGTKCTPAANVWKAPILIKCAPEDTVPYALSVPDDTVVIHSSFKGSPSARDEIFGSWLIQTICKKINEQAASEDFESILMKVKRDVALNMFWLEFDDSTGEYFTCKQMPTVTSTLRRQLYLRKFEEVPTISFLDQVRPFKKISDATSPLDPFASCSCFLDHFSYIKKCLIHFIEENPKDVTAQNYLRIANTFEDGVAFNAAKEKLGNIIYQYLNLKASQCSFIKYMYINGATVKQETN